MRGRVSLNIGKPRLTPDPMLGNAFREGAESWLIYWMTHFISALTAQATSDTEYTITATIVGTGQDGMSVEYSSDMGVTWTVKGTSSDGSYSATGMTSGTLYQWRARLYKGTNYGEYVDANNYLRAGVDEPCLTCTATNGGFTYDTDVPLQFYGTADKPFWISLWIYAGTITFPIDLTGNYRVVFNAGMVYFRIYDGTAYIARSTPNTVVAAITGSWHHLVFNYDGSGTHAGIRIFVDKVRSDNADVTSGTFAQMDAGAIICTVAAGTGGRIMDYRVGSGVLTDPNITDLYDHKVIGTEIIQYPCSEGYGDILHNVANNNNVKINGVFLAADENSWANTQDLWKYNYEHGGTKVDDYFFPNKNDKSAFFTPIYGIVQAGQSNATSNYGVIANLAGGDYDEMTEETCRFENVFEWTIKWAVSAYPYTAGYFGVPHIIAFLHEADNKPLFILQKGVVTTGLYPGSSEVDWHPETVGEHFDTLNTEIQTRLLRLFQHGREPVVKSFIWIHGELDSGNETYAAAYYDNLVAFFNRWKTEICSTLNIQITELNPEAYTGANRDTVRTAQHNFVANYGNAQITETDGATTVDGQHYDAATIVTIAESIYENIKDITPALTNSYLHKLIPTHSKLYYTAHP